MIAGARAIGMPESAIANLTVLYGVVRAGYAAGMTADFEKVTGRKTIAFKEFAQTAAAAWNRILVKSCSQACFYDISLEFVARATDNPGLSGYRPRDRGVRAGAADFTEHAAGNVAHQYRNDPILCGGLPHTGRGVYAGAWIMEAE